MILVPFESWHFKYMDLRQFEKTNLTIYGSPEQVSQLIEHYALLSCAFTAFKEEDIIGIGGIMPIWKGVGEAWILTSPRVDENKIIVGKTLKLFLDSLINSMELHRVQCAVQADFKDANRLAKWLGFEFEGVMRAFGVNKLDYNRYARIISNDRS